MLPVCNKGAKNAHIINGISYISYLPITNDYCQIDTNKKE